MKLDTNPQTTVPGIRVFSTQDLLWDWVSCRTSLISHSDHKSQRIVSSFSLLVLTGSRCSAVFAYGIPRPVGSGLLFGGSAFSSSGSHTVSRDRDCQLSGTDQSSRARTDNRGVLASRPCGNVIGIAYSVCLSSQMRTIVVHRMMTEPQASATLRSSSSIPADNVFYYIFF